MSDYCKKCGGFGYTKEGAQCGGWVYCVACSGLQVRPKEDYEPERRAIIERRIVHESEAMTVTELVLSDEAKAALCTGVSQIPSLKKEK